VAHPRNGILKKAVVLNDVSFLAHRYLPRMALSIFACLVTPWGRGREEEVGVWYIH
jgi:hypothetical protein